MVGAPAVTIYDDAMEQIRLMQQGGRRPYHISFSNKGWDKVRAEHRAANSALDYGGAAPGPRSYLGLPHSIDRKQKEPVLVLTLYDMRKRELDKVKVSG